MVKKAAKIITALFILLGFISGCWDGLNIDDRDICTAVVVDKQEDNFVFFVEIPAISSNGQSQQGEQGGGQHLKTAIICGSGKTYAQARESLDERLNKPIYLGAVQSLILTEKLADSGIEEYALRVRQLAEYRKTMDVVVTPDNPADFLGMQPENVATVGFAVEETLETYTKLGKTYHMSLADLLQKLSSTNPCYLMNTLGIRDGQVALIGSTVFDGGKRIGYIPVENSRGIVLLTVHGWKKPTFDYVVSLDDKTFTVETTGKKLSIKAFYDGHKPSFSISMSFEGQELYPSARLTVTEDMQRQIIEKLTEQIRADIENSINQSQKEYECDYLSFSEPFRISYPEAYEVMNWHEEFKKAEFSVKVSVKLTPNRSIDYHPKPLIDY